MKGIASQLNFFNSINLTGDALAEMIKQCHKQEGRILEIMHDGKQYTPFDVMHEYNKRYHPAPIGSIRRAMTCLTINQGFLIKCEKKKMGDFGKPNFVWTIKRNSLNGS